MDYFPQWFFFRARGDNLFIVTCLTLFTPFEVRRSFDKFNTLVHRFFPSMYIVDTFTQKRTRRTSRRNITTECHSELIAKGQSQCVTLRQKRDMSPASAVLPTPLSLPQGHLTRQKFSYKRKSK